MCFAERLESLGLSQLTTRRVRSDYKSPLSGINEVDKGLFFEFDSESKRGHTRKLFKRRSRLDIRKYMYTFSNRIVDKWNSLSQDCINYTTIDAFKEHIQKHLEPETLYSLLLSAELSLVASVNSVNLVIEFRCATC